MRASLRAQEAVDAGCPARCRTIRASRTNLAERSVIGARRIEIGEHLRAQALQPATPTNLPSA